MKNLNIFLIAAAGLMIIVSGCLNNQDAEQKQNLTQNITNTSLKPTITADVVTGHVLLNHRSGDEIPMNNFTIIVEQGDIYFIYEKLDEDDKFAKGDILDLTPNNVYLNDKTINAKISTNNSGVNSSGVIGNETIITLISNGNKFAQIVSRDEFFE